jgi:DGQHR domain-containing protein
MAKQPNLRLPFSAPSTIPVVLGPTLRSGVPIISGFMPAGIIVPHNYKIPYHDARTKKGYQRLPQDTRINELVADLRKERVDLPTAILLNLRHRDSREAVRNGVLHLDLLKSSNNLSQPFYVVDGQHRVLALEKLVVEYDPAKWSAFVIPFVCMLGATEDEEMDQFYIVNSKAKSVRTDLAYALLRQRAERDPAVMEQLLEKGRDWQVRAEELVEFLAEKGAVWRGRIRLAAMDKGETTMPSASMVSSLRPLLTSPYFGSLNRDQQLKLLDAFWRGLRDLMKDAFDAPQKYVVQKGVGVTVLHVILVQVIEIVRSKGLSPLDPDTYSKILRKPLSLLQGENQHGETVSGMDFWRVAPEGAAGSYSSSAGKRVFAAKLRQLMPDMEIE